MNTLNLFIIVATITVIVSVIILDFYSKAASACKIASDILEHANVWNTERRGHYYAMFIAPDGSRFELVYGHYCNTLENAMLYFEKRAKDGGFSMITPPYMKDVKFNYNQCGALVSTSATVINII